MNYQQRLQVHAASAETESVQLIGSLVRVSEVTSDQRDQMYDLMSRYYENMCRESFDQDLKEKDWVIIATHPLSHQVMGFSTQMLIDVEGLSESGWPTKVLFSGDTIIERAFWSRNPLAQLWGRLSLTLIDEFPNHDLFWFLISKGFRTYRFLPVFFKEFFPRCDAVNSKRASDLIRLLGSKRYPALFDSAAGIIRANEFGCKLRTGVGDVSPERLTNKHVDFFHQVNPGHASGDELCCVARLSRENFKRGAYRVIGEEVPVRL